MFASLLSSRRPHRAVLGRPMRSNRLVTALVAVLVITLVATGAVIDVVAHPQRVHAQPDIDAARRAADEIQAARDRANAASQAVFDTEARIDALDLAITASESRLAALEREADEVRTGLEGQAVRTYTNAGAGDFPLLLDFDEVNDGLTAEVFSAVSRETAAYDLDEFDALMTEIDEERAGLARDLAESDAAKIEFERLKVVAEDEVVALGRLEEQRLADEAVQIELARQRREREAAIAAAAEAERAAAAAVAAAPRASTGNGGGDGGGSTGSGSTPGAATSGAASPTPSQGGASPTPAAAPTPPAPAAPPPSNAGSGIVCPVSGPRAFADTWGAARSGGRSHQGVDLISPGGTPLVAVESGSANFKTTSLGGNSVWVTGNSGTKYFYAHLSRWEGSSRSVSRGEVIGYVGATGNTTTNHLHFEVHPGGGAAVNPYPYVRAVC